MIDALTHFAAAGVALVAVLVVGLALLAARGRHDPWPHVRDTAAPVALAFGGALFSVLTAITRSDFGAEAARSSRYVYSVSP